MENIILLKTVIPNQNDAYSYGIYRVNSATVLKYATDLDMTWGDILNVVKNWLRSYFDNPKEINAFEEKFEKWIVLRLYE